ncbi:MAG: hypothetical protein IID37_05235 [Planctomycetes bacterium]|nr:hypothetical protein [Planctomycetota bacterium]
MPSTGRVQNQAMQFAYRMIHATTKADAIDLRWENAFPAGYCRNRLIRRFLADPQWTHLLFVDTDMAPPADGLDRLLEVGAPLVAGPAPILLPGGTTEEPVARITTNIMDAADPTLRGQAIALDAPAIRWRYRELEDLPAEPFTCDATGGAFLLIQREVLERMEPPWLTFVEHPDGRKLGPDAYFFRKARQLGYELTIQPKAVCDHIKGIDLTHMEGLITGAGARKTWPAPPETKIPRTVVLACTRDHWSSLPTTEVLLLWQGTYGKTVMVRSVAALSPREALARFMHDPLFSEPDWTHVLILGPDVVPERETLASLATVDGPIVSAVTRRLATEGLVYGFTVRDPVTGKIRAPSMLPSDTFSRPAEVHSVDLACALVTRDTLGELAGFLTQSATDPDPDASFCEQFCSAVIARGHNPVIVPTTVERWAEIGLMGLLNLKQQLAARKESAVAMPTPEPVGAT